MVWVQPILKLINNIIEGGSSAASISGPNVAATWAGQYYFQYNRAGDMPEGGYIIKDPKLNKDDAGLISDYLLKIHL